MPEDLEVLRKQKKMKVGQLAGKTGISAKQLVAYEKGEFIPLADRQRLARALFVDVSEINPQSTPKPKAAPKPAPKQPAREAAVPKAPAPKAAAQKQTPARSTQIDHLLGLAAALGQTRADVETAVGKPLADLTQREAKEQLGIYHRLVREQKEQRPPNTRRTRGDVPESVDTFELNYLQARQEAGDWLHIKLFDGSEKSGRLVGFSPYTLVIAGADGVQTAVQKLAIAYYTVAPQEEAA